MTSGVQGVRGATKSVNNKKKILFARRKVAMTHMCNLKSK